MKRVLFLAYYFPPGGGAGVQRSLKFVRYLRENGYEPVVVTGPAVPDTRWTPADVSLLDELPEGTEIIRAPGPHPADRTGWGARAERWLRLEPPWAAWWRVSAVEAGRGVEGVDLVYASMSPWESGEAAATLAEELGVPWVADLRDPWALDEMTVYPSRLHRRLEKARMRTVLASASAIVANTPEAARVIREELPELASTPLTAIPNGFDAADFEGPAPTPEPGIFRIVHAGYLHTDLGRRHDRQRLTRRILGGATPGVDILPRSHLFLLAALDRVLTRDTSLVRTVRVDLVGIASEADRSAVREATRFPEVVRIHGYLPHEETVALLRGADLLFLPMHDLPAGQRATIVPGKSYEYLGASRPVLAAVPDGDCRDLMVAAGNAHVCRPRDVDALERALLAEIERARRGADPQPPHAEVVARFERRRLARELCRVFDSVAVGSSATSQPSARAASSA